MARSKEKTIIGYGCEDVWVMDALRNIVYLAINGKLNQNPYFKESPSLSPEEAEGFEKLMNGKKIAVKITPFDSSPFMECKTELSRGKKLYQISMRPDVAAVVKGLTGFDVPVYLGQNSDLVGIVKQLSQDPSGLLRTTPVKL